MRLSWGLVGRALILALGALLWDSVRLASYWLRYGYCTLLVVCVVAGGLREMWQ